MDLGAVMDRFDGDQELFLTLAGIFVGRSAHALATIQAAVAAQDMPLLIKEAHKLKGSALEFCAHQTVAAAAQLEEAARKAATEDLAAICERVLAETQRLTSALDMIIEQGFPS
jgi:HPt (histidine-containing phosphotransfer) domain-containing protein